MNYGINIYLKSGRRNPGQIFQRECVGILRTQLGMCTDSRKKGINGSIHLRYRRKRRDNLEGGALVWFYVCLDSQRSRRGGRRALLEVRYIFRVNLRPSGLCSTCRIAFRSWALGGWRGAIQLVLFIVGSRRDEGREFEAIVVIGSTVRIRRLEGIDRGDFC